jgi:hypothetical protein
MTGLPIESPFANDPNGGVSDDDRGALGDRLNQAYASGDLSAEDYKRNLDLLYAAQRKAELVPIAEALPARFRDTAPAGAVDTGTSAPQPGDLPEPAGMGLPIPGDAGSRPDLSQVSPHTSAMMKFALAGIGVLVVLVILLVILL